MKLLCWLLCSCLAFGTACRKRKNAASEAPDNAGAPAVASSGPATPAPPAPAASVNPAPSGNAQPIPVQHFNQLSEALLKFRRDKKRAPKDWQELIATGYLKQMPEPPPGKRYVFDRSLNVQVVNQ